jgi:hypothetical protein
MNGIRKVLLFTLAGSILSAVLTASILTNKVTNVDDNFDLSTIDSAYADSTNSLFLGRWYSGFIDHLRAQ